MLKKLNKKKKGFTLIELVIVLAVLAIIALIAIPNFTKVRNDSLEKADTRTMEQIEKITLMAIANEDIDPESGVYTIKEGEVKLGATALSDTHDFAEMLKEVKDPQVNGKTVFKVTVASGSEVTVTSTK